MERRRRERERERGERGGEKGGALPIHERERECVWRPLKLVVMVKREGWEREGGCVAKGRAGG
jgi:hypothetical protein